MFPHLIVAFLSDTVPVLVSPSSGQSNVPPMHGYFSPASTPAFQPPTGTQGARTNVEADFWENCGLPKVATEVPPGLGELAISLHLFAGVCAALLHQQRTGEGQVLHLNPRIAGVFSQGPSEPEGAHQNRPWFHTKDKKVIRLLGKAGATRDTWHLMRAVGKLPHSWAHCSSWCTLCSTSCCCGGDDLQDHQKDIASHISECTLEEIAKVFDAGEVDWWCEELDAKAPPLDPTARQSPQASPCGVSSTAWLEARGKEALVAPALITCSAGAVGIQVKAGGAMLGARPASDGWVPLPVIDGELR
jgi:hypothetical protein